MKWITSYLKNEFSQDNVSITLLIILGFAVAIGLIYFYVQFIHYLGFYGNSATVIGLLGLIILGLIIRKPKD